MGEEDARKQCIKALNGAVGKMRGEVTRRARLRVAPEIVFVQDIGIERGQRIQNLLHAIEADRQENPIKEAEEGTYTE